MSDFRTRNFIVTAKVESPAGQDAAPTVGANAVRCLRAEVTGGPAALETEEATGGLDPAAPVPGGGGRNFASPVRLAGSGAGGTAPDWGVFARAGGLAETTRAADLTGTAQAGAAGSITLAAGATGINVGDLIETTGGTGSGQTRVVKAWDNGTKVASVYPNWSTAPDATTTYAVRASQIYVPASESLANISWYRYQRNNAAAGNAILTKILGAVTDLSFTLGVGGFAEMNVAGQGKFVTPADVADPGDPTLPTTTPPPFMGADVSLAGVTTKIGTMTLAMGSQIAPDPDPGDTYGIDVATIRARARIAGRINPPMLLRSAFDPWTKFLAATEHELWLRWGTALGNSFSLYLPRVLFTGAEDEDLNGSLRDGLPFAALGLDSAIYLTAY